MSSEGQPTSRRARRLAEAARHTEIIRVVASAEVEGEETRSLPVPEGAAADSAAVTKGPSAQDESVTSVAPAVDSEHPLKSRRAADGPVDAVSVPRDEESKGERSSQLRARDREAHLRLRELAEKESRAEAAGLLPSRRALRDRKSSPSVPEGEAVQDHGDSVASVSNTVAEEASSEAVPPTSTPGTADGVGTDTASFRKLNQEQINAARELLREQARNQTAMIEAQGPDDPTAVDPEVLAQQVEIAERAAVLNRRAADKQRLESSRLESENARRPAPAAAAADNLAMVTPLEFVQVPGIAHPVMKPPSTSHIPIVTGSTPKVGLPEGGPDAVPISARSAHGLELLGAADAGMGRASRERSLMISFGVLGLLALVIAMAMIFFWPGR